MTYDDSFTALPLTTVMTARMLHQQGDTEHATYWRGRPPQDLVYTCNFHGPVPTASAEPGPCPAGQDPVVIGVGPLRSFLVDAEGHATEMRFPTPPVETCEPTGP